MVHKLNSPHEWLLEKARHWNALYDALSDVVCRLDGSNMKWTRTAILSSDQNQVQRPSTQNLGAATEGIRDNASGGPSLETDRE